jgi:peroxiredoxin (alkyl hydroperoxide reductase subunit C)
MQEILRVIDALKTTDQHGVGTPANWLPGDPVIMPAPRTIEDADARKDQKLDYVDWYFAKKTL